MTKITPETSLPLQTQTAPESEQPPLPQNWPIDIHYLTKPVHSPNLSSDQLQHLTTKPLHASPQSLPVIKLPLCSPSPHVSIRQIKNPEHPAYLQYGLFALSHLPPETLVIPYLGYVHSNDPSDVDDASDYDLSLDRTAGISVDAANMGNEARMCNDYRGVPVIGSVTKGRGRTKNNAGKPEPNAEFRDVWFDYGGGTGELGIAIFVRGAGRSGRFKGGVGEGDEILVNYGKGFWNERRREVGDDAENAEVLH